MARWQEFAAEAPEMAETGREIIYNVGIGLGYLATVRKDGGPRIHPFCPIQAAGGLYGFLIDSPKRNDLLRDGRYAIHSFPKEESDDEFYLAGTARREHDSAIREEVVASYRSTGGNTSDDEWLFEFDLERVMLALYRLRSEGNTWPPTYSRWAAAR